ncbi:MAG: aminotransferase class I/II-fold pyridoxal phosphate-dependent enzyme, partial [Bacteroidia bacterium]
NWGVTPIGFNAGDSKEDIIKLLDANNARGKLKMIYAETPANPTNDLIDIEMCSKIAEMYSTADRKVLVTVDNTYMGPLWQHPLKHGADIVLYSATKYIGGHSDLIAGAAVGSKEIIKAIKKSRTVFGTMIDPHTSWLLMRSLETLKIRMEAAATNAEKVAEYLLQHPKVEKVYYLGYTKMNNPQQQSILEKQYLSNGAMLSFDVKGGEKEAFAFLNNLKHIKLAVSLGGTESLAEHPYSMTHADEPDDEKNRLGLTEKMVRLSVGIENYQDIIWDIDQAFNVV